MKVCVFAMTIFRYPLFPDVAFLLPFFPLMVKVFLKDTKNVLLYLSRGFPLFFALFVTTVLLSYLWSHKEEWFVLPYSLKPLSKSFSCTLFVGSFFISPKPNLDGFEASVRSYSHIIFWPVLLSEILHVLDIKKQYLSYNYNPCRGWFYYCQILRNI